MIRIIVRKNSSAHFYLLLSLLLGVHILLSYGNTNEKSASIWGSFYNFNTFERINNVVMEINTTPPMRIVITNGYYLLNLTPGCYNFYVYTHNDDIIYSSSEALCLDDKDKLAYDFILLPTESTTPAEIEKAVENISVAYFEDGKYNISAWSILFVVIILLTPLASLSYVYLHKHFKAKKQLKEDPYMEKLLHILREEKRITQKDIKKRMPLSEGKISLMLAELEDKGLIKKIKKGRTNIIYWKGD